MSLIILIILLIVSLYFLTKSADYFITYSEELGKKLNFSEIVIGLLIVSIGTSLPEFFTSIISLYTIKNYSYFVVGDIIGSNIANICLVLGIFYLFNKHKVSFSNENGIIFALLTIIFSILIYFNKLNKITGLVLLIITSYYLYKNVKNEQENEIKSEVKKEVIKKSYLLILLELAIAGTILVLSSKGVIISVEEISKLLNIGPEIISLSIVAFGTSLPELFVTISAIKLKKKDIAIGNILGSDIINIGLVIGVSTLIKPFNINPARFYISIIMLILSGLLILYSKNKKNTKVLGAVMLILYFLYIILIYIKKYI